MLETLQVSSSFSKIAIDTTCTIFLYINMVVVFRLPFSSQKSHEKVLPSPHPMCVDF